MASEPTFTWDEVSKHNKDDDCWLVVNNKVYDVTDFVDEHPGSFAPILTSAGKDATRAFVDKPHSKRAHIMLEKYFKGHLAPSTVEATKPQKTVEPEVESPVVDRKAATDSTKSGSVRKQKITFSEFVTHNKKDNLWILVHGKVYDVTNFKSHPGSFDKLLQNSAKDASVEFDRVGHKAGSIVHTSGVGVEFDRMGEERVSLCPVGEFVELAGQILRHRGEHSASCRLAELRRLQHENMVVRSQVGLDDLDQVHAHGVGEGLGTRRLESEGTRGQQWAWRRLADEGTDGTLADLLVGHGHHFVVATLARNVAVLDLRRLGSALSAAAHRQRRPAQKFARPRGPGLLRPDFPTLRLHRSD